MGLDGEAALGGRGGGVEGAGFDGEVFAGDGVAGGDGGEDESFVGHGGVGGWYEEAGSGRVLEGWYRMTKSAGQWLMGVASIIYPT